MRNRIIIVVQLVLFVLAAGAKCSNAQEKPYAASMPELRLMPRKLELNEDPKVLERPYVEGSRIIFRIQAMNRSYQPITLVAFDPYFQNRPQLFQGGQLVEYPKRINDLLEAKEKDPFRKMVQPILLQPEESKVIEYIRLEDWYDELPPGHYVLLVKHRFETGNSWIESSSLDFEIIPNKPTDKN